MSPIIFRSLRGVYFVQAYTQLLRIHKVLAKEGFTGAQAHFVLPWKPTSRSLPADHPRVREIERAVDLACKWQWQRTVCLHRATLAYCLLRQAGAQPTLVTAVVTKPFTSHAWTEIGGVPIADAAMALSRCQYKPILRLPGEAPALPGLGKRQL